MNSCRRLALLALLSLALIPVATAQPRPDDAVVGLWAYESGFAAGPTGELTIARRGTTYQGSIGGATAEASPKGRELRIKLTNEGDAFRGYLDADGRLQRGFWARHELLDDPRYPEGASQAYAMPLALRATGSDRWQATVAPLADPFILYLNSFRDDKGVLKAAIRNPEHHRYGPAMQLFATVQGNRLRLGKDATPGDDDLTATIARNPERIEMYWDGIRRTVSLKRA